MFAMLRRFCNRGREEQLGRFVRLGREMDELLLARRLTSETREQLEAGRQQMEVQVRQLLDQ